ncbi:MAG: DUF4105 domain-containing protein [bacterium]|nr:DUF4105 domain-containing protein [bacterium]
MKSFYVIIFLCFSSFCPAPLAAQSEYITLLIDKSKALNLADEPQWLTLGHYKKELGIFDWKSLVDDPEFFLAKAGKTDPQAELDASIKAIFSPPSTDKTHASCLFPARAHWLAKKLGTTIPTIHDKICQDFLSWKEAINASRLTLIFPTAYLNNPASMFGHTLLRLDQEGQTESTRLLAYGANFGAATDDLNGFIFAVKGLSGGYRGAFTVKPYYDLVNLYSDMENRDIWEYELNFTKSEVEMIVRHLWEMRNFYFDYYFFDENCSYQLLGLLEAGRPGLSLTDKFTFWAIPNDTVRALINDSGTVEKVTFRPAQATTLKGLTKLTDANGRQMARGIYEKKVSVKELEHSTLSTQQKAEIYDIAYSYLTYQRNIGKEVSNELAFDLLKARSQLHESITPEVSPNAGRPELGHLSSRLAIGGGSQKTTKDGWRDFASFKIRPAFHDILSPAEAFVHGAGIRFLDTEIRHYENSRPELENLALVDITSLTARDIFFKPLSWHLATGLKRTYEDLKQRPLVSYFSGSSGLSYQLYDRLLISSLLHGEIAWSNKLPGSTSFYSGPEFIILADLEPFALLATSRALYNIDEQRWSLVSSLTPRFQINVNNELRLDFNVQQTNLGGERTREIRLEWCSFF